MIDLIAVGKKIANYRLQNNWSQDQLAQKLCVTRQAISNWEKGIALPTVDNLVELTNLFLISIEELLCLYDQIIINPDNIFQNHRREFIVQQICTGKLKINLVPIFHQFTKEERFLILYSFKNNHFTIEPELFSRLTFEEQVLIGGKIK